MAPSILILRPLVPEENLDTDCGVCEAVSPTASLATLPGSRQQMLAAFCLNPRFGGSSA